MVKERQENGEPQTERGTERERRREQREGYTERESEDERERVSYYCSNEDDRLMGLLDSYITYCINAFTFTFSHVADAFVQSDAQGREQSSYEQ